MMKTKEEIRKGLPAGLLAGLIIGLLAGLVEGLVYGLVTQIIAYFSTTLVFSPFDFWSQLILLIIIQVIGWIIVYRLKEVKDDGSSSLTRSI